MYGRCWPHSWVNHFMSSDGSTKRNTTVSGYLHTKQGSKITLLSRNDKNRSESFPAFARTVRALRPATLLLDGEVIALDRHKISRFQLLQRESVVRAAPYSTVCM